MKIKILWVPNLGLIPVLLALLMAYKARALTVSIACFSIYAVGCFLDLILSLLPPVRSAWDQVE